MAETIRLSGRPQLGTRQTPERAVAARQGDYLSALPRGDAELEGLLDGLQALNPAIQAIRQENVARAAREAEDVAKVEAARVANPVAALQEPVPAPVLGVPPALADDTRRVFQAGVSQRAALKIRADALQDLNGASQDPNFNFDDWMAKTRSNALQGLGDAVTIDTISRTLNEFEGMARNRVEQQRLERIQASFKESALETAADLFTANKDPQTLYQDFQTRYVPAMKAMGMSRMEAAQYLMGQLEMQSAQAGGVPELFDVFTIPDEQGRSIADYAPQLGTAAAKMKAQALERRENERRAAAMPKVAEYLMGLREREVKDPESITREEIMSRVGPDDAFTTPAAAAAQWEAVVRAQMRVQEKRALSTFTGPMVALDPSKQQAIMDTKLGPLFSQAMTLMQGGQSDQASALMGQIIELQSAMGTSVPWDTMKNWATSLVSTLPSKDGPTPQFQSAASLYRAMAAYPALRDRYFANEDIRSVLETYTSAVANQTDPAAAYFQAYAAIEPGAKAAAKALTESAEFRKMRDKEAQDWVAGSTMNWLRVFNYAGRPQNATFVGGELQAEMYRWRTLNPSASAEQAAEYAERWTKNNFVMDATSRMAVKVPPALASEATGEVISNFTASVARRLKLGSRSDTDWTVMLAPAGTEGEYMVMAMGGGTRQMLQTVRLSDLLAADVASKNFTPEELPRVGELNKALAEGRYGDVDPALLAKAVALKQVPQARAEGFFRAQREDFKARLDAAPRVPLAEARDAPLAKMPDRGATVDLPGTARSALNLLGTPMVSQGTALAASLVAMGEGLVLKAYDDPAKDAGKNIGFGYNLKANARTAKADLKAALVPEDKIEGILNGTAALLPEQAERLLRVSLGRYERQAKEVIEEAQKGLWSSLTPAQQAVMTDIAYQTGNPGKFKKAIAALVAKRDDEFRQEAASYFTNRKGEWVEDKRRNGLRAAMLAGIPNWEATVLQFGKVPGDKLAALSK